MKPDWKSAPQAVRERVQLALRDTTMPTANGGTLVIAAAGVLRAIEIANARGYAFFPEDVPQTHTKELERLEAEQRAETDPKRRAELGSAALLYRRQYGPEIDMEGRAMRRAQAAAAWNEAPSETELAAKAKAEREAREQQEALERRADAILQADAAKRREKALAAAAKEMEPSNG